MGAPSDPRHHQGIDPADGQRARRGSHGGHGGPGAATGGDPALGCGAQPDSGVRTEGSEEKN